MSAFIPFFLPVFYYVDHPSGHHVYTQDQMKTYASSFWNVSSDTKVVDRTYIKDNSTGQILSSGIANGTNDVSIVLPATGKVFKIPFAEAVLWSYDRRILGGDMYYDRLTLLEQLGRANYTAPETTTPVIMASPPPSTLPPGPPYVAPDDLRGRHNWLHAQWNEGDLAAALSYVEPQIQYVDQATGQILTTPEELANLLVKPMNASSNAKIANSLYYQSGDQTFSKFTLYGTNDQPFGDNPQVTTSL